MVGETLKIDNDESVISPLVGGNISLRVERHDKHSEGNLTIEGKKNARLEADKKVNEYLEANPDTNFLVIASDQIYDPSAPELGDGGMRAVQTAEEIVIAIKDGLEQRNLPADHLFGSDNKPIVIIPELREADIHSNNGFMEYLKLKYPEVTDKQDLWKLYYQDVEADERKIRHAESSSDLAERMDFVIKTAEMVAASFYRTPGKEGQPLVVWIVCHGGGIDSYAHRYSDAPVEELGFPVSGGFIISMDPEIGLSIEIKGKKYPLNNDDQMIRPIDDRINIPKI